MKDTVDPYPGENATPEELCALADIYASAADHLSGFAIKHHPLTRAPWRLCAMQAIELYLNAYLRHHGASPGEVRGHRHDVAQTAALARRHGLILRKKTARHLSTMVENREYLVTRYAPERRAGQSQINRLAATLAQVQEGVRAVVKETDTCAPAPPSVPPVQYEIDPWHPDQWLLPLSG